jgi:hypothetical protein
MNTKTSKIIITIIALAIPSISYSQIDKASAMQAINEFKAEESSEKLQQCVNRIEREPSLSDSSRVELLVQVLAASVQYLEKHPKPTETPQINVAPPDDSIAGADPASIKDPVVRAQYEKDIAANKALAEAHRKHGAITAIRDKLTAYCVSFSNTKHENKKLLSELLRTASSNPETVKTVVALIEKEDANKTQQDNR